MPTISRTLRFICGRGQHERSRATPRSR
jgi:hypothetical protein